MAFCAVSLPFRVPLKQSPPLGIYTRSPSLISVLSCLLFRGQQARSAITILNLQSPVQTQKGGITGTLLVRTRYRKAAFMTFAIETAYKNS